MVNTKVKILPYDEENIEKSRQQVMKDTRSVVRDIIDPIKCDLNRHHRLGRKKLSLTYNLNSALYWRTLNSLDGPDYREFDIVGASAFSRLGNANLEKSKEITRRNQAWTKKNFSELKLWQMFNVVVNQAILKPISMKETCRPGTDNGHMSLYEKLVNKDDSMFSQYLTPEFIKMLNNGRFWESLHHRARFSDKNFEDVLQNHFDDLDPSFCKRGMFLIEDMNDYNYEEDMFKISKHHAESTFDKYLDFIKKVDEKEKENLFVYQMNSLLIPYITEILSWDDNFDMPTYRGSDEFEPELGHYLDKLKDPFVQKYLIESTEIREAVAKSLYNTINFYMDRDEDMNKYVTDFVVNVINNTPSITKEIIIYKLGQVGRKCITDENPKVRKVINAYEERN